MKGQVPTFMLLPNFTYRPDTGIHLGSLLPHSHETDLPDPDRPLNETTRVPPPADKLSRQTHSLWRYENGRSTALSGGLQADIPVLLPTGGGVHCETKSEHKSTIECESVSIEQFIPTEAYLAQTLNNELVQSYCSKSLLRPTVYLVTGLMIAPGAVVTSSELDGRKANLKFAVDATDIGIPLNVGPAVDGSTETTGALQTHIKETFILAYQLKRLKVRHDGSLKSMKGFNSYALFDDKINDSQSQWAKGEELLRQMESDDVTETTFT